MRDILIEFMDSLRDYVAESGAKRNFLYTVLCSFKLDKYGKYIYNIRLTFWT